MERSGALAVIVLAAGRGERLGEDKAGMVLGAETAIERVVRHCSGGPFARIVAVRRAGATPLPDKPGLDSVVEVESDEMIESLRAGLAALEAEPPGGVLVFPIDYAMVGAAAVAALAAELDRANGSPAVVLPICRGRPGHPVGLEWSVAREVLDENVRTLRDVIRRDRSRVVAVAVEDGWTRRDIDRPEDLRAARGYLANLVPPTVLMARHRSRRSYLPDPVADSQIRWLVDSARHASSSSFVQASSVVVVRDPERKRRAAELCADQAHIHAAPVFLAVCADLHRVAAACEQHGAALQADSLELFVQATVDAALFGQNLQLAAESEGLGACMIGAARNHPNALAELLGLPDHAYVVFGMTLGWPDDDPLPRGRMALDAVLHTERYRLDGTAAALAEADERMREWARATNARASAAEGRGIDEQRGWTDRMAFLYGGRRAMKGRELLLEELRRRGFGLRPHRDEDT